eukprot:TRINITY_DN6759_c0_g1_i1.p2 TRINITY_DN6759_c0_g1~~TRINITY_DN6759_c0_g1_i1.p2  ORF type:complete len:199 (-),score=29.23 TRINITY_DN6759_c0_g1_i1:170-766(-)
MSFKMSVLVSRMALKFHIMDDFDWNCATSFFLNYIRYGIAREIYDILEKDSVYEVYDEFIIPYLNLPEIQAALGVDMEYSPSNQTVYELLKNDWSLSLVPEIEQALDKGIKVFLYYGDKDYVCNYLGGEYLSDSLNWEGQAEFLKQPYEEWKVDDIKLAEQRVYKNLALIKVFNTGHTIFFKQRKFSEMLLNSLIKNE